MKNLFSSLFFLLFSNFVFGQIEWVGNFEFSESASDIVRTSQGQYILVHGGGNGLTVFDASGDIVFEKWMNDYPSGGGALISEIVEMSDSSVVFSAGWVECDIIVGIVTKFDKNWNQLWMNYNNWVTGPAGRFNDNSFIVGDNGGSSIEKWSKDGAIVWEKSLNKISDLVVTDNDTILVATEDGLVKMDAAGNIAGNFPNLIFNRLELLPNGNFIGQNNDVLYLYDQDFAQFGFFQQQGDALVNLAIGQNEIAVLTSAKKVILLDLDLNQIGTTVLAGHNQSFTSVAFVNNGFMVGGGEQYGNGNHQNGAAFIKQVALDGSSANTAKDAALTSVQLVGLPTAVINWWGAYYKAIVHGVQVTVENMGTTTINRLNVNFHHNTTVFLWECAELQAFSKSFENLNLQPGATMVLDWGDQSLLFNENPAGQPLDLCFWTSLPDHHLETNNDNDVSCTEVLVAAHERFPINFSHTFNPVTDELHLDLTSFFENDKTKARIFNAAGQMVRSEAITTDRQAFEMNHLPDGAYFLQIVSGQRVGWGKFAKY